MDLVAVLCIPLLVPLLHYLAILCEYAGIYLAYVISFILGLLSWSLLSFAFWHWHICMSCIALAY